MEVGVKGKTGPRPYVSEYVRYGPGEYCALACAIAKTMRGMNTGSTFPLRHRAAHVAHDHFKECGGFT